MFMESRVEDIIKNKSRELLWFLNHNHIFTQGTSASKDEVLNSNVIEVIKANRGGKTTYHGPGQLVGYPILDLDHFFPDIHKYLRYLEEVFIKVLADYGLKGERSDGETGVWFDVGTPKARKILALGVRASRWVTMHGWAFNVNTDLSYFGHIVPCGIYDKEVTSLKRELGHPVDMAEIEAKAKQYFCEIFEVELI